MPKDRRKKMNAAQVLADIAARHEEAAAKAAEQKQLDAIRRRVDAGVKALALTLATSSPHAIPSWLQEGKRGLPLPSVKDAIRKALTHPACRPDTELKLKQCLRKGF